MIRSTTALSMLTAFIAIAGCSKSDGSAAAAGSGSAGSAKATASFASGGAGACDKYLTSDVLTRIIGSDADERKVLSAQSCTVRSTKTDGSLTITLKDITPQSFHAFRDYLSDPQPLPGVGDSALSSIAPTVTAIKGNMGCDFDAMKGSSPTALGGAERAKALGDICNKIFAGTP
jgi:hypothetical protein